MRGRRTAAAQLSSPEKPQSDDVWEKDMSNEIYIEASHEGFHHVKLQCTESKMIVEVLMEAAFEGIFYTRGSYKSAKPPCYFDATGDTSAKLEIPLDKCKNKKEEKGGGVSNTVIVQYDDYLIYPGDTAFEIACDGSKASVGLADPDPSAAEMPKHRKSTVTSEEGEVTFTPDDIRPRKKKKEKTKKHKTNPENLSYTKSEL